MKINVQIKNQIKILVFILILVFVLMPKISNAFLNLNSNLNSNFLDINEVHKTIFNHNKSYELIYFWATWCITCKPKLQDTLVQMNKRNDLAVITINIDEDINRVRHYIKKNKIELPVLYDKSREYIKQMKVVAAPHWAIYKREKNNNWTLLKDEEGFDLEKINNFLDR